MSDPYGSVPNQSPQSAAASRTSGGSSISQADLIAGVGALITVIFSFLAFYEVPGGDQSFNAWDTDTSAFASTVPAILGIALLVVIGLGFANVKLPDNVLTFTPDQVKATWGIAAAGIMISFIASGGPGVDKGIGFWFMLIGSLIMAAGTIMRLLGKGTLAVAVGTPVASSGVAGTPDTQAPGDRGPAPPPPPPGGTAPPPPPPGI